MTDDKSLCLICYKTFSFSRNNKIDSSALLQRFLTLLERQLGAQIQHSHKTVRSVLTSLQVFWCMWEKSGSPITIMSCADCTKVMESFCTYYHEMKCLELKLMWRLHMIKGLMKLGGRVPSRVKTLREICEGNEGRAANFLQSITKFRKDLIRKCSTRTSLPRVVLTSKISCLPGTEETPISSSPPDQSSSKIKQPSTVDSGTSGAADRKSPCHDKDNQIIRTKSEVLSLIAVILLTTLDDMLFLMIKKNDTNDHELGLEMDSVEAAQDLDGSVESGAEVADDDHPSDPDPGDPCCTSTMVIKLEAVNEKQAYNSSDSNQTAQIPESLSLQEESNCKLQKLEAIAMFEEEVECSDELENIHENLMESSEFADTNINEPTPVHQNKQEQESVVVPPESGSRRLRSIFRCEVCRKTFSSSTSLESHRASHTPADAGNGNVSETDEVALDEDSDWANDGDSHVSFSLSESESEDDEMSGTFGDSDDCDEEGFLSDEMGVHPEQKSLYIIGANRIPNHRSLSTMKCSLKTLVKKLPHEWLQLKILNDMDAPSVETFISKSCEEVFRFQCEIVTCSERFATQAELEKHAKLHGKFNCKFCNSEKSETYAPYLAYHEVTCNVKPKPTRGSRCPEKYSNQSVRKCPRCSWEKSVNIPVDYVTHHLVEHLKLEVPTQMSCPLCRKRFSFRKDGCWLRERFRMVRHIHLCHNTFVIRSPHIFTCTNCPAPVYFSNSMEFVWHRYQVHGATNNVFTCDEPECAGCTFSTFRGLSSHRLRYHRSDPKYFTFKCTDLACQKRYASRFHLNTHMFRSHSSKKARRAKPTLTNFRSDSQCYPVLELTSDKFKCQVESCPFQFSNTKELENHQTHHGTFKCAHCSEVYDHAPALVTHEMEHDKDMQNASKISCTRCTQTFDSSKPQDLEAHFLDKHLSLPWATVICSICQKGSVRQDNSHADLIKTEHFNLYHNVSDLDPNEVSKCGKCPAVFRSNRFLGSHELEVHGETGTVCNMKKEWLHLKILNEQDAPTIQDFLSKPLEEVFKFQCESTSCSQRFVSSVELEKHSALYGEFKCNFCNETETYAPDLANHEATCSLKGGQKKAPTVSVSKACRTCPRCPWKFSTDIPVGYVAHHITEHMGLKVPTKMSCPLCQKGFFFVQEYAWWREQLVSHMISCHDTSKVKPSKIKFCDMCPTPVEFTNTDELDRHKYEIHDVRRVLYTCDKPGCYGMKFLNIETHNRKRHNNQDSGKVIRYECKFPGCITKLRSLNAVRGHVRRCGRVNSRRDTIRAELGLTCVQENSLESDRDDCDLTSSKFQCDVSPCDLMFGNSKELENHKTHHKDLQCDFCQMSFNYAPDLAQHILKQHTVRRKKCISCPRCPKTFYYNPSEALMSHFLQQHLSLPWATIICPICQKGNLRKDGENADEIKIIHFNRYHLVSHLGSSEVSRCDQCPAFFSMPDFLQEHKKVIHGVKKAVPCGACNKSFATRESLLMHMKKIHQYDSTIFPFACERAGCSEVFTSEALMKQHFSKNCKFNSLTQIACPTCKKVVHKNCIKWHMRHCGNKKKLSKHVCEKCGKVFREKMQLGLHMLAHLGPDMWEYCCEICGKKCLTQHKLDEHMRVHTKEKPFCCAHCGEKYAHRHNLRNHVNNKHGDVAQDLARSFDKTNLTSRKGISLKQPGDTFSGKQKRKRVNKSTVGSSKTRKKKKVETSSTGNSTTNAESD